MAAASSQSKTQSLNSGRQSSARPGLFQSLGMASCRSISAAQVMSWFPSASRLLLIG
jgi:hypothetical protein